MLSASKMSPVVFVLVMLFANAQAQTMPTGCTYASGLYTCDYDTLSSSSLIPLSAAGFTPIAQRLRVVFESSVSLTTAVFDTDFASIATASYDTNYPATLELECLLSATLTLASGFLANMDHVEDFKIVNCALGTIPASTFSELGTLDRFSIENGTITSISDTALSGVSIIRNTSASPTFPKHHGEFSIKNTKYGSNTFSGLILSGQTSLYSLVLRNMGLTTLDTTMFDGSTGVRYVDLSYNQFTTIPSTIFSALTSLGVINLYGFDVDCSCSNVWFLEYAATNYVTLNGDIICYNNTEYDNKLAWAYYYGSCIPAAVECENGILLLGACLSVIDLVGYSIGLVAFILGWVVLGLTIHTQKQMGAGAGNAKGKPGARKRPPPKKGGPKKGWA